MQPREIQGQVNRRGQHGMPTELNKGVVSWMGAGRGQRAQQCIYRSSILQQVHDEYREQAQP
jgi:hypothetical protein